MTALPLERESASRSGRHGRSSPQRWRPGFASLARLLEPLFPRAERPNRARRLTDVAIPFLIVVSSPAILLARVGGLPAVSTIWAEDGELFMSRALRGNPIGNLFQPAAGYLLLWPRALGEVGTRFTIDSAASYYAWAAALSVGLCAAMVYAASSGHVTSRFARLALALALMFLPAAVTECVEVVANIQWFVIPAVFWALLWRPATRGGIACQAAFVAIGVASSPICLLLAPLALARLLALREWRDRAGVIAFGVGAVAQVVTILGTSRPRSPIHPSASSLAESYGARIVLGSLDGIQGTAEHFHRFGWAAVVVAGAVFVVAVILCSGRSPARIFAAAAIGESMLLFGFSADYSWLPVMRPTRADLALYIATRYSVAPIFLLLGVLAVAGSQRPGWLPGPVVPVLGLAILAQLASGAVSDFSLPTPRAIGPTWAQSLAVVRASCAGKPASLPVQVPITPAQWYVSNLTCGDLDR